MYTQTLIISLVTLFVYIYIYIYLVWIAVYISYLSNSFICYLGLIIFNPFFSLKIVALSDNCYPVTFYVLF